MLFKKRYQVVGEWPFMRAILAMLGGHSWPSLSIHKCEGFIFLTATVTMIHFGSYFLSTRRGPRVVPQPATFKLTLRVGRGARGGDGGAGEPRTTQNQEIRHVTVTVAVICPSEGDVGGSQIRHCIEACPRAAQFSPAAVLVLVLRVSGLYCFVLSFSRCGHRRSADR